MFRDKHLLNRFSLRTGIFLITLQ